MSAAVAQFKVQYSFSNYCYHTCNIKYIKCVITMIKRDKNNLISFK